MAWRCQNNVALLCKSMAVPVIFEDTDGMVDLSSLSIPEGDDVEVDISKSNTQAVRVDNFYLLKATKVSVGGNLCFSLSQPLELRSTLVVYSGPVLYGMILPAGLRELTIIETPKSAAVSKINIPETVSTLKISLTGTFSPIDEMVLPPQLKSLVIDGEHDCSLELVELPPSLTYINTGSSVQPVDRLQIGIEHVNVVSASKRLVEASPEQAAFETQQHVTLTSSLPLLRDLHTMLPRLQNISVILDETMWPDVGSVWCKLLLEGRLHADSLHIINNTSKHCMRDVGEVFYRSTRLRRPICHKLQVVGEIFDYPTSLRMAEAIRKYDGDIIVEVQYSPTQDFPECCLHRISSILGCTNRDAYLSYHSKHVVLEYDKTKSTVTLEKKIYEPSQPEEPEHDLPSQEHDHLLENDGR